MKNKLKINPDTLIAYVSTIKALHTLFGFGDKLNYQLINEFKKLEVKRKLLHEQIFKETHKDRNDLKFSFALAQVVESFLN